MSVSQNARLTFGQKLKAMARCLWHGHAYEWMRNIYGDEINFANGKRSLWVCSHCGWDTYKPHLHAAERRED